MPKTYVIVYDYSMMNLNNPEVIKRITQDIADPSISKIIIPSFIFQRAYSNIKTDGLKDIINLLKASKKVFLENFCTLYKKKDQKKGSKIENYNTTLMILYLLSKKDSDEEIFLRTDTLYLKKMALLNNIKIKNDANIIADDYESVDTKSNAIVLDTCYLSYIYDCKKGLNLLNDKRKKTIIFSAVIDELIRLKREDILDFLIELLNRRKYNNIHLIQTENAYVNSYFNADAMMLTHILGIKNSSKIYNSITLFTCDLEFAIQASMLGIEIGDVPKIIKK